MHTSDAGNAGELVKSHPGRGLEYGYCTCFNVLSAHEFAN